MADTTGTVARAAGEIYAVEPEQFTAERKKHVEAAKRDGEAAAAKQIQAFGKPTRSAWILNRLARTEPDLVAGLEDLAASLREAQDALDGDRIRELSAQRRAVVDEIARAAYGVTDQTPSTAVRDEVAGTITAALLDPEVLAAVRSGTLVRAAQASGFGGPVGPSLAAVPDLPPPAPVKAVKSATQGRSTPSTTTKHSTAKPTTAKPTAEERRARLAAEREERRQAQRAEREQRRAAAAEALATAEQAETDQRATVRMLAEQLADARRLLGERELDARRAKHALARAEKK